MSHEKQAEGLEIGRKLLKQRISGTIDPAISYMSASAYGPSQSASPKIFFDKNCSNIILMLHSFFDSPHVYSSMIYPDFLSWVLDTISICEKATTGIPINLYAKPHPNRFTEEDRIIAEIAKAHPSLKLIDSKTKNNELAELQPTCIVTVYGSVAAEFSYMRVPVITCGDNPTSNYNFTFQARSREQYINLLHNSHKLKLSSDSDLEVCEFMYMHNYQNIFTAAQDYPFRRSKPHEKQKIHERIVDFDYKSFSKMINQYISNH